MINQEILNYVIVGKIGEGSMGQVFLARNKNIDQYVAIKMLHSRFAQSSAFREAFKQEALMLASLDHPHIVKFLNYLENEKGVFLIMEYVDGMTLEDFINKKNGLIVEQRALPMFAQILDAFAYAHGRGIIHRDIKASNILQGSDGNIKVLDFGIAQIMSESDDKELVGSGTVAYMSPEQALDRPIDLRSDIYSLGVLLFKMLTARSPYNTDEQSVYEIKKRIIEEPLPRMKDIYPYIGDNVQALVDKATQKNPDNRFENANEMLRIVEKGMNFSGKTGMQTVRINKKGKGPDAGNISDSKNNGQRGKALQNGRGKHNPAQRQSGGKKNTMIWWVIVAVLFVLGIAGAAAWWYLRDRVVYYAHYDEQWEKPIGIDEINEKNISDHDFVYKFEYEKGNVVRVTKVDSKGNTVEVPDSVGELTGYSDFKINYDDDGNVTDKVYYRPNGKEVMTVKFSGGTTKAEIKYADNDSISLSKRYVPAGSYRVFHKDDTGRREMLLKVNDKGEAMCESDSVYGFKFDFYGKGLLKTLTLIGSDKFPHPNAGGVAIVEFVYDDNGKLINTQYYDKSGKIYSGPVMVSAGADIKEQGKKKKQKKVYKTYYNNEPKTSKMMNIKRSYDY